MGDRHAEDRIRTVLEVVPGLLRPDRSAATNLRHICELGCTLFEARYAAAALLRDDGSLSPTAVAGIPEREAKAMAPLQSGSGLLAELMKSRGTLLIPRLSGQEQEEGLPSGHPAISSFLGARLRAHHRTVGVLYLGDRVDGAPFTEDDEALMRSLAATLGAALDNSALLRDALQSRRWMRAANNLTRELFAGDPDETLRLISDQARDLAQADLVGLAVLQDGMLVLKHMRGLGSGRSKEPHGFPLEHSIWASQVVNSGRGEVVSRLPPLPEENAKALRGPKFGPAMMLPLHGAEAVLGVLFLARREGAARFTETDVEIAGSFANHVAVMLELATARETAERLRMVEDRNRIARDLHDHVVQRLFATGLSLQQVVPTVEHKMRDRIHTAVVTLDETIREIRNTILTLRSADESSATLDTLVSTIAQEVTPLLGFAPLVALEAPSGEVSGALASDLAACIREGLSNVVRHAHADTVEIFGTIEAHDLVLTLHDNGVGIHSTRRSGLHNLATRMRAHGGSFEMSSPPEGGTVLTWRAPLPSI
jgi:signal transduction histidine kinase